jgi:hypothetical protein
MARPMDKLPPVTSARRPAMENRLAMRAEFGSMMEVFM